MKGEKIKGLLVVAVLMMMVGGECRCAAVAQIQAASRTGQPMEMTANPNEVAGCTFQIRVDSRMQAGDWANSVPQDKPGRYVIFALSTKPGGFAGTAEEPGASGGELYFCADRDSAHTGTSQAGENFRPAVTWTPSYSHEPPAPTPTPRPVESSNSTSVRVVRTFEAVAGCTYLAEANPQAKCQKSYEEPTACMAWQTAAQGGNTLLLDGDKGHIYRCAKP